MLHRVPAIVLAVISISCGGSEDEAAGFPLETAEQAVTDYKTLVSKNYADVVAEAEKLQGAIDAFLAAPSAQTQAAAKAAWIAARAPYGPSEAFRFYDGPIDNAETGPEGQINAWPLDENYIDYTRDAAEAGLVNDVAGTPDLTAQVLADANEAQGEKAISTGYHAIEFLLWGQDDATPGTGAGKRAHTDYLAEAEGGTHPNADRRATYLGVVTDLLIADLQGVAAAWAPGKSDNFAATFGAGGEAATKEAIGNLLRSMGSMAKAELSGERMTVAYKNRSEEDEHSCFSDNTAADLLGNGVGIQNTWLGKYGTFDGVGLDEVVAKVDGELAKETTAHLADSVAKLKALDDLQNDGKPIDVILQADDASSERKAMLEAIRALKTVAEDVEKAAAVLGLTVQLEEPSEEL